MKRTVLATAVFLTWLGFVSVAVAAEEKKPPEPAVETLSSAETGSVSEKKSSSASPSLRSFSSVVNVIRRTDRIEAVFRNGESFALPRGGRQPAIFKALSESERSGKPVTVTVDERSGTIESAGDAASAVKTPGQ